MEKPMEESETAQQNLTFSILLYPQQQLRAACTVMSAIVVGSG